jgi:hypothetical protein
VRGGGGWGVGGSPLKKHVVVAAERRKNVRIDHLTNYEPEIDLRAGHFIIVLDPLEASKSTCLAHHLWHDKLGKQQEPQTNILCEGVHTPWYFCWIRWQAQ